LLCADCERRLLAADVEREEIRRLPFDDMDLTRFRPESTAD
jgi:hypothetical protein